MNNKKRKRTINQLFHGRFHSARSFLLSAEDRAWENVAPVGREFGSPEHDQLMRQDFNDLRSNLSSLVAQCSDTDANRGAPSDAEERKQAGNVQFALRELGQDVTVAVAAAVWRHHSNSLMAGWMSGAETVASAKRTILFYCTRKPTNWL